MRLALLPSLRALLCALPLAAAVGHAQAQDVELFEEADFGGMRISVAGGSADLNNYGMPGRVSSIAILRGNWELCTQPNFRGTCLTLGPGRYARLPVPLNDSFGSMRALSAAAPVPAPSPFPGSGAPRPYAPGVPETYAQPAITLYSVVSGGNETQLVAAEDDLRRRGFNDIASTIWVRSGVWELCSDRNFAGDCLRFGPGRHVLPPALRDRLSSLRPVAATAGVSTQPQPQVPVLPGARPWQNAAAAITLFDRADFGGRPLSLTGAADNLDAYDWNDRTVAVEIARGQWELCQRSDFRGQCLVLGPGRHVLDRRLAQELSSVRPVFERGGQVTPTVNAVTLHDQDDLRGRTLFVDAGLDNLRDSGMNDRAVVIEVHGGSWQLCSDSNFRGRCTVFGPGWHRLPEGLAREVSSLRPVR